MYPSNCYEPVLEGTALGLQITFIKFFDYSAGKALYLQGLQHGTV